MGKFLTDVNLNQNEIQNVVIQNLNADPIVSTTGQIYYNSAIDKLRLKTPVAWVSISNGTITIPTLDQVLNAGNISLLDAKIGELYLYDYNNGDYGKIKNEDSSFSVYDYAGKPISYASHQDSFFAFSNSNDHFSQFNNLSLTATRVYDLPNNSGTIALTSDIPTIVTPTLDEVLTAGNTSLLDAKIGSLYLYDNTDAAYGFLSLEDGDFRLTSSYGRSVFIRNNQISFSSNSGFEGLFRLPNITTSRIYDLPNASGTIALTSDIPSLTGYVPTTRTLSINGTTYDLTTNRSWNVGTVTSIGVTVPSAFNITPSTITTSGTFAITGAGTTGQYVRGDGTLGTFPGSPSGGGASISYYLNGSINSSVAGYKQMSKNPVLGLGTDFTTSTDGLIAQFLTDVGDPALLNIPGGSWLIDLYFNTNSAGGSPSFYIELLKYNGTTFTSIATSIANAEVITNGTSVDLYTTSLAVPITTLTLTDRLVIKVFVNCDGKIITLHTEDSNLAEVVTTFSTGISAINGLTTQIQYFTTGISGSNFNISSSIDTHTFNLPVANATNTGKLSNTDWVTFNSKQNTITLTTIGGSGVATFLAGTLNIPDYSSALTGYVPYTGATGPVDLGAYNLTVNGISVGKGSGTGDFNTAVGSNALLNNTTGTLNTAIGRSSLVNNTIGNFNVAIGLNSLQANITGGGNSIIGANSFQGNTGGSENIGVGYLSGTYISNKSTAATILNRSIMLGYRTSPLADNQINQIVIGYDATGAGSNTVTLGNTSITTTRLRGAVQGGSFVKDGGTSSQYLMADGSVSTGSSVTPAALTKTNDTNVTLTLGGTPTTSLLEAVSLTLGWTGTLADSRITSAANWNTAYTNRITSLTTTGSGAATLVSNVLNIPTPDAATFVSLTTTGSSGSSTLTSGVLNVPTYTLSGLGGQPLAANLTSLAGLVYVGTSFIKMTGVGTFTHDNNTYATDSSVVHLVGTETITGKKTFNPSVTASGAIAQGTIFTPTLTASANSDTLIALDINPTFATGGFTSLANYAIKHTGDIVPTFSNSYNLGGQGNPYATVYTRIVRDLTQISYRCDNQGWFNNANTQTAKLFSTGDLVLQNGGTFTDLASSRLTVNSTTQGILPPRMTTAQKNAIASPATGLLVYDTDLLSLYQYNGSAWVAVGSGGGSSKSINSVSVNTNAGSTASTDYIYLASGTINVTLPTAVGNTNYYTIKNTGTGVITVNTTSSQTIDGSTTAPIKVQYLSLTVISDGANWNII